MLSYMDGLFQRAYDWACRAFGESVANDTEERGLRFAEEAIELAQAVGVRQDQLLSIMQHVYSRPLGDVEQEVAGTLVCLAVLCHATNVSADVVMTHELRRIERDVDKVRARFEEKKRLGLTAGNSRSSTYWIYHDPRLGFERLSSNHPVESGDLPEAENVREATTENLRASLLKAWEDVDRLRKDAAYWSEQAKGFRQ